MSSPSTPSVSERALFNARPQANVLALSKAAIDPRGGARNAWLAQLANVVPSPNKNALGPLPAPQIAVPDSSVQSPNPAIDVPGAASNPEPASQPAPVVGVKTIKPVNSGDPSDPGIAQSINIGQMQPSVTPASSANATPSLQSPVTSTPTPEDEKAKELAGAKLLKEMAAQQRLKDVEGRAQAETKAKEAADALLPDEKAKEASDLQANEAQRLANEARIAKEAFDLQVKEAQRIVNEAKEAKAREAQRIAEEAAAQKAKEDKEAEEAKTLADRAAVEKRAAEAKIKKEAERIAAEQRATEARIKKEEADKAAATRRAVEAEANAKRQQDEKAKEAQKRLSGARTVTQSRNNPSTDSSSKTLNKNRRGGGAGRGAGRKRPNYEDLFPEAGDSSAIFVEKVLAPRGAAPIESKSQVISNPNQLEAMEGRSFETRDGSEEVYFYGMKFAGLLKMNAQAVSMIKHYKDQITLLIPVDSIRSDFTEGSEIRCFDANGVHEARLLGEEPAFVDIEVKSVELSTIGEYRTTNENSLLIIPMVDKDSRFILGEDGLIMFYVINEYDTLPAEMQIKVVRIGEIFERAYKRWTSILSINDFTLGLEDPPPGVSASRSDGKILTPDAKGTNHEYNPQPPVIRDLTQLDDITQIIRLFKIAILGESKLFESELENLLSVKGSGSVTQPFQSFMRSNAKDLKLLMEAEAVRVSLINAKDTSDDFDVSLAIKDPAQALGRAIDRLSTERRNLSLPDHVTYFLELFSRSTRLDRFTIEVLMGLEKKIKRGKESVIPRMLLCPYLLTKSKLEQANFSTSQNSVMETDAESGSSLVGSKSLAAYEVVEITSQAFELREFIRVVVCKNMPELRPCAVRDLDDCIVLEGRPKVWQNLYRQTLKPVYHAGAKRILSRQHVDGSPIFEPPSIPFEHLLATIIRQSQYHKPLKSPIYEQFGSFCTACRFNIGLFDSGLCFDSKTQKKKRASLERSGQLLCAECAGSTPELEFIARDSGFWYLRLQNSVFLEIFPKETKTGEGHANDYQILEAYDYLLPGVKPEQIFFLSLFMPVSTLTDFIHSNTHIDDHGMAILAAYVVWGLSKLVVKLSDKSGNLQSGYLKQKRSFAASAINVWKSNPKFFQGCTVKSAVEIKEDLPIKRRTRAARPPAPKAAPDVRRVRKLSPGVAVGAVESDLEDDHPN